MRIGVNGSSLLGRPDLGAIVEDVAAAEAAGFDTYWLAQTGLLDSLTAFAVAGASTSTIEVGTAVVPTWPQHPQSLAGQALTAQAAVGGRLTLGIGLGHQMSVEGYWRMKWEKPIRHILDFLDVLQPLLETGAADVDGEVWSFGGQMARPQVEAPKVMLAALGDQMLKIAGRRTDGTILWCVGPKTLETQIVPKIGDAAAAADRPTPSVVCSLPVWVTDDADAARAVIAKNLTIYGQLPSYRAMLDIEGVDGPADISLVGSEEQVRDGLGRIAEAGATDFTGVVSAVDPDERARTTAALAAGI